MDGYSNGYPWDNQDKCGSFDINKKLLEENARKLAPYIKEMNIEDIPLNTIFLVLDPKSCFGHESCVKVKMDKSNSFMLFKETYLDKKFEESLWNDNLKAYMVTNNTEALKISHWYRSIPLPQDAELWTNRKVKVK